MSKKSKKSKKESTLYYFTSTGCAFCKQIDPIIEKLNNLLPVVEATPQTQELKLPKLKKVEKKINLNELT